MGNQVSPGSEKACRSLSVRDFGFWSAALGFSRLRSLRSQEKQAWKIVRFQRHLPLTIQFYTSCRISGVPPLQSDFSGLSSALKDDTNEPKKRKEARTKPTKMARKKSTLRMTRTTTDNYLHLLSYQHLRPAYSKVAIAGEKARRNGSAASWHGFSA